VGSQFINIDKYQWKVKNKVTSKVCEVSLDITERKRVEQAILQAKVEWEQTFDSVPDLIAIIDIKQV
jgi:PAS domain-containing protein